jgi:hypothetical protein
MALDSLEQLDCAFYLLPCDEPSKPTPPISLSYALVYLCGSSICLLNMVCGCKSNYLTGAPTPISARPLIPRYSFEHFIACNGISDFNLGLERTAEELKH